MENISHGYVNTKKLLINKKNYTQLPHARCYTATGGGDMMPLYYKPCPLEKPVSRTRTTNRNFQYEAVTPYLNQTKSQTNNKKLIYLKVKKFFDSRQN